jgi:hypothetical protein
MDVCSDLPLFGEARREALGARRTADAVQIPIHAALTSRQLDSVARRLRRALRGGERRAGVAAARLTR